MALPGLFCLSFGTKLYRQIVVTSLSDVKQAEIIEALNSTSRYLDDLLIIDKPYFEGMVNRIYPPELTEAPFIYFKWICFI